VKGNNQSTGCGWTDLIMVVTATNNDSDVAVVSQSTMGAPPSRTYRFDNTNKRIEVTTNSATTYTVTVMGWGLAAGEI
ncbi:MAG: hypothetical protein M1377_05865, partial [Deltaproteobacteria bacterium]|nr:hypothetical protein [Deltaproteobacteria bacterium]